MRMRHRQSITTTVRSGVERMVIGAHSTSSSSSSPLTKPSSAKPPPPPPSTSTHNVNTEWYKGWLHFGKSAQSTVNSLLVSLLISLTNFWNWLGTWLNISSESFSPDPTGHHNSNSISTLKPTSKSPLNSNFKTSCDDDDQEQNTTTAKMTIEVSTTVDAMVNPDTEEETSSLINSANISSTDSGNESSKDFLHCSLPPVLRINSESFDNEDMFEEEDDEDSEGSVSSISSDTNRMGMLIRERSLSGHRNSEDSCSDYCSGSGSLPGSPLPADQGHTDNVHSRVHNYLQETATATTSATTTTTININTSSSILIRMDSDNSSSTSDSSANNNNNENNKSPEDEDEGGVIIPDVEVDPDLALKIISQVETLFSDDHLAKDGFLLKHVRRRSDGFVSLKLVAGLRKVKQLAKDFPVVLTSLKRSDKLEVNDKGNKIRRKEPLTTTLKALPIKQAKKEKSSQSEKENQGQNSSSDEPQKVIRPPLSNNKENNSKTNLRNQKNTGVTAPGPSATSGWNTTNSRRNSNQFNGNTSAPTTKSNKGPSSRKNSNVSTISNSSGVSSRNNSFSSGNGRPHPADLLRQGMFASSGEDSPQVVRRRGGSLPVSASYHNTHRGSTGGYLSPNSSPPNAGFLRPKSNSYSEGHQPQSTSTSTMSSWLLARKASVASSQSSSTDSVTSLVIRAPRGPDGTKGFAPGYRTMILKERLTPICSLMETSLTA